MEMHVHAEDLDLNKQWHLALHPLSMKAVNIG